MEHCRVGDGLDGSSMINKTCFCPPQSCTGLDGVIVNLLVTR